jgi:hypothetical protein
MITYKTIQLEYLEFFNNYLTIEKFAEHRGLNIEIAKTIIENGKFIHENIQSFED